MNPKTRNPQHYNLVAIGGGGGTSHVLRDAQPYFANRTAVIAVTDTGRSTGIARALANIPAPGDLRNTLATLSENPESLFAQLLQHRFFPSEAIPALDGMAFGNLLIAALTEMTGDFAKSIDIIADLIQSTAHILPVSTINTHLCAELQDGSIMENELAVRGHNKAPIKRLFLADSPAPAYAPVLEAIAQADVVAIGPGSFFTSVMATLLFDGIVEALQQTHATVAFVCNSTTQPGQTDVYRVVDHVAYLVDVLGPGVLDVALINRSDHVDTQVLQEYAAEGLHLLHPDEAEIAHVRTMGIRPIVRDYVKMIQPKQPIWNKQDTIRYDPTLLGYTLWRVIASHGTEIKPTRHTGSDT